MAAVTEAASHLAAFMTLFEKTSGYPFGVVFWPILLSGLVLLGFALYFMYCCSTRRQWEEEELQSVVVMPFPPEDRSPSPPPYSSSERLYPPRYSEIFPTPNLEDLPPPYSEVDPFTLPPPPPYLPPNEGPATQPAGLGCEGPKTSGEPQTQEQEDN